MLVIQCGASKPGPRVHDAGVVAPSPGAIPQPKEGLRRRRFDVLLAFKRTASGRHSGLYEKRPGALSYQPWPCEWRLRIFSLRPRRRWRRLLRLGEISRLPRTRQWYFRRYLWLFGAHL